MTSNYSENWDDDVPYIESLQRYWRYTLLNKRMYGGVYYAPIDENNPQEMKRLNEFLDGFNEEKNKYKCLQTETLNLKIIRKNIMKTIFIIEIIVN